MKKGKQGELSCTFSKRDQGLFIFNSIESTKPMYNEVVLCITNRNNVGSQSFNTEISENSVRFSGSCISHLQSNSGGAGVGKQKCSNYSEMDLVRYVNIIPKLAVSSLGSAVNIYPESDRFSHLPATTLVSTTIISCLVYRNEYLMASQLLTLHASARVGLQKVGSCWFKP